MQAIITQVLCLSQVEVVLQYTVKIVHQAHTVLLNVPIMQSDPWLCHYIIEWLSLITYICVVVVQDGANFICVIHERSS